MSEYTKGILDACTVTLILIAVYYDQVVRPAKIKRKAKQVRTED